MPTDLPKTSVKFLIALLKHQAENLVGKDAAGILGDDVQSRLDDWLKADKTAKDLLHAAEQTQIYLQDELNCPDRDLRHLFRDISFGDLPTVQSALTDLPRAMDSSKVQEALRESFTRDFPNLTPSQQMEGARLYAEALLMAAGTLELFTLPIILKTLLDFRKEMREGQAENRQKLDTILNSLQQRIQTQSPSPTLPGNLPLGSYIPFPRNHNFTGRVDDLRSLKDSLLADHQPGVIINQTVTGMGGIGKTQLAVEFAYQYGHLFKGVHWLDLRDPQAFTSQIALCGEKMGLPNWPEKHPEQVALTLHEWKRDVPRLLILDNFEDPESANDVLAELQHSGLRLLITSRRIDWNSGLGFKPLSLDEFKPEESRDFLRKYLPANRATDEELNTLATHLGHLPLALELAGRYLEKHPRLKISAYLEQLKNVLEHASMQNWKPEQKSLTGHDLSLLQTFALSWEQIKDENTKRLFITCGYCAPNTPIPDSILNAVLGEQADSCDECLAELVGLGLLKGGEDNSPMIHPLLASYARGLAGENDGILKSLVDALGELTFDALTSGIPANFYGLTPHTRIGATHAEEKEIDGAGKLWSHFGSHLDMIADYQNALTAHERAIKIWEASLGTEHPQVAIGVNNLGGVLRALGDLAGAKAAFERALKIHEAAYGPDHPSVATDINNLGMVLQDLGDLTGAKAAFERVLKILEKNLPPGHPYVASTTNNLGSVLQDLGDLAGAKAAGERALKIFEKILPPDHPSIKIVRGNLESLNQ